jgi:hypothetical protein
MTDDAKITERATRARNMAELEHLYEFIAAEMNKGGPSPTFEEMRDQYYFMRKYLPDVLATSLAYTKTLFMEHRRLDLQNDVLVQIMAFDGTRPRKPTVASMTQPMGASLKTKKQRQKGNKKK